MRLRVGPVMFVDWPSNFEGETYLITPGGVKWFGGLTVRRNEIVRPLSHGAFPAPSYLPQKVIPVSGELLAPSAEVLEQMKRKLTGLCVSGVERAVCDDERGSTWRDVGLAVQASFGNGDETSCPFEISFWAADPRAYGEAREYVAGETAYHYGNYAADPVVTVTGAGTAYTLSSGGRVFSVSSALPSGSTDVVDMRSGRVLRNGSLLIGGVASAATWSVPAGAPTSWSVSGASARLTVLDTFV